MGIAIIKVMHDAVTELCRYYLALLRIADGKRWLVLAHTYAHIVHHIGISVANTYPSQTAADSRVSAYGGVPPDRLHGGQRRVVVLSVSSYYDNTHIYRKGDRIFNPITTHKKDNTLSYNYQDSLVRRVLSQHRAHRVAVVALVVDIAVVAVASSRKEHAAEIRCRSSADTLTQRRHRCSHRVILFFTRAPVWTLHGPTTYELADSLLSILDVGVHILFLYHCREFSFKF